jgi:hypothetical protein
MSDSLQYIILIALVVLSSILLLNEIIPITASFLFCFTLCPLLIKIAKNVSN